MAGCGGAIRPVRKDGLGVFRNLHPQGSSPAKIKAAPGIRLMEQTSLNQRTPSAGSSTSASASAVPSLYADPARAEFVGNYVALVGNFGAGFGKAASTPLDRHPELVSGSIVQHNRSLNG